MWYLLCVEPSFCDICWWTADWNRSLIITFVNYIGDKILNNTKWTLSIVRGWRSNNPEASSVHVFHWDGESEETAVSKNKTRFFFLGIQTVFSNRLAGVYYLLSSSILIWYCHLHLGHTRYSFLQFLLPKYCTQFSPALPPQQQFHRPWFGLSNSVWRGVQIMKLLSVRTPLSSSSLPTS